MIKEFSPFYALPQIWSRFAAVFTAGYLPSRMQFLQYLTPEGVEMIDIIKRRHYHLVENDLICRGNSLFGLRKTAKFIICTSNIWKYDPSRVSFYVNETFYHEALHVAQECKGSNLGLQGIYLPDNKEQDVRNSLKFNPKGKVMEREAYYLEDKPEEVLSYLRKYCL